MRCAAVVFVLAAAQALAFAQDSGALDAFRDGDYARAEMLLREALEERPGDWTAWYNLACALAQQGKLDAAAESLVKAIEHGFDDIVQIGIDPHLEPMRGHTLVEQLRVEWPRIVIARADAREAQLRERYGGGYAHARDDERRLLYVSDLPESSFAAARAEVEVVHAWCVEALFTDLREADEADAYAAIVLPNRRDFVEWIVRRYGPEAAAPGQFHAIGGAYDHDAKQLVAQDIGATLRHEYAHVLHWRSMTRLGQRHPIYIQEGLCALVEDLDRDGGVVRPARSWRTNIAQRLAKAGRLPGIEDFARTDHERFQTRRPMANYAIARSLFLYVHERGELGAWYAHYTEHYRKDPLGIGAFEAVLGKPIGEVDRDWRDWLRALEPVAEEVRPGDASLGVDVDPGRGDGPLIARVVERDVRRAGLKRGDVITGIDGAPVRDVAELVRVLGGFAPGDVVVVSYRRGSLTGEARVALVAR